MPSKAPSYSASAPTVTFGVTRTAAAALAPQVEEDAQGWPSTEGRILSGKVAGIAHTSRFLATLQYSYYFEDKYHYGKYTHEFSKKVEAEEFVRQMKDKRLQIRYKPSNPDKSVLEQRVIEQYILLTPRFG